MLNELCRLVGYPVKIFTEAECECGCICGTLICCECNLVRVISNTGKLYCINPCEIIYFEEPRPVL